jgi:hypothetical protein
MKILRDEKGQTLVLTALCMTALLGFLALSVDVGMLFRSKRCLQTAADAAAIAAAQNYMWKQSASLAQTAGKSASSVNGYTDGTKSVTVTINVPPTSGPNSGAAGFAEAIVTQPMGTPFIGMFGRGTVSVSARAVAATPNNGSACIWLMAPSGNGLSVKGNYDIEAPGCGIYVNSPDSNALKVTGNGGTVNAAFLDVVGNNSGNHTTQPTTDTLNAGVRSSPWGNLSGPSTSDCTQTLAQNEITLATDSGSKVSQTTINSYFTNSSTNAVICFSGANVTVDTGVILNGADTGVVYRFAGNVTIPTGATVQFGTGTVSPSTGCTTNCSFSNEKGATVDLAGTSSTINQNSNSILNMYAPASLASSYDGIAILQPSTNSTTLQIQFGSNNQVLDGYIYAPAATVFMQDHGGGVTASGIVAGTLFEDQSVLDIYTNYDTSHGSTTVNRRLVLVE